MPQGKPLTVPDDGLTTRQRRNRPLLMVHTGDGKGKSTAAFGLAMRGWNQGWDIGVFQFVKSAKWRIGEQTVLERLGRLHEQTGEGGPVEWHKMGSGWSWSPQERHRGGPRRGRRRGLGGDQAPYRRRNGTSSTSWTSSPIRCSGAGSTSTTSWRHWSTVPAVSTSIVTGRRADPRLIEAADLVTEMSKVKHPMDVGQKGQRGIEW